MWVEHSWTPCSLISAAHVSGRPRGVQSAYTLLSASVSQSDSLFQLEWNWFALSRALSSKDLLCAARDLRLFHLKKINKLVCMYLWLVGMHITEENIIYMHMYVHVHTGYVNEKIMWMHYITSIHKQSCVSENNRRKCTICTQTLLYSTIAIEYTS